MTTENNDALCPDGINAKNAAIEGDVDTRPIVDLPLHLDYIASARYETVLTDITNWYACLNRKLTKDEATALRKYLVHFHFLAGHTAETTKREMMRMFPGQAFWLDPLIDAMIRELRYKQSSAVQSEFKNSVIADVLHWSDEEKNAAAGYFGGSDDLLKQARRSTASLKASDARRRQPARDAKQQRNQAVCDFLEGLDHEPRRSDFIQAAETAGCSPNTARNVWKAYKAGTLKDLSAPEIKGAEVSSRWAELYRKRFGMEPIIALPRFTAEDQTKRREHREQLRREIEERDKRNAEVDTEGIPWI